MQSKLMQLLLWVWYI